MTAGCDLEALEDLARERLPAGAAAEREAHVRGCPSCTQELAWLRAERALLHRPPEPAPPPAIWREVERRIALRRRLLPTRATVAAASFALAAAAALALMLHPPGRVAGVKPVAARDADVVLDSAEQEYRQAIAALETALAAAQARGSRLSSRWRTDLAAARTEVADARGAAGRDPDARLRVLDGYAAYLRSLQTVVLAVEEQRP